MKSDRENLLQDGLYSHDFMEMWLNCTKLNLEYMSIYVNTFQRTSMDVHKLVQWDLFYDTWFSNMERTRSRVTF
jgi:hypothetical protein